MDSRLEFYWPCYKCGQAVETEAESIPVTPSTCKRCRENIVSEIVVSEE